MLEEIEIKLEKMSMKDISRNVFLSPFPANDGTPAKVIYGIQGPYCHHSDFIETLECLHYLRNCHCGDVDE